PQAIRSPLPYFLTRLQPRHTTGPRLCYRRGDDDRAPGCPRPPLRHVRPAGVPRLLAALRTPLLRRRRRPRVARARRPLPARPARPQPLLRRRPLPPARRRETPTRPLLSEPHIECGGGR